MTDNKKQNFEEIEILPIDNEYQSLDIPKKKIEPVYFEDNDDYGYFELKETKS